jgi:hypothetical protein
VIVKYDPALADLILDRMAEGEGMDAICADSQMPPRRIVRRWLVLVPEFLAKYNIARDLQAESVSDSIIRIEQQVLAGELTPSQASTAINSMQWRMQRLCPRRWGQKVEVARPAGELRRLSDEELENVLGNPAGSGADTAVATPRTGRLN